MRNHTIFLSALLSFLLLGSVSCLAYNADCAPPADLEDPEMVVGYLARSFPVDRETVRTTEVEVGSLIAASYMDAYNNPENPSYRPDVEPVDGAFENAGAIRDQGFCEPLEELPGDPVKPPPIRRVNLREVLPFTNRVVVVELTAGELYDVLEHSVSALGSSTPDRGHLLQLSEIALTVDCSLPAYERVSGVWVGGEQVHPGSDRVFRLATNDFLLRAEGNDGFETLAGRARHNSLGQYSFEVVEDYLLLHSSEQEPYDPPEPPRWMHLVDCD